MTIEQSASRWLARLDREKGPIYIAVVDALEAALRSGELQPGERLPPQRLAAEQLGVDLTTITRAYALARTRGLVEGTVGKGTFVRARAADEDAGLVDLSMNLPPPPEGTSLSGLLRETTSAVLERTDAATLMAYHPGAGTSGQKVAAASWLAPCLGDVNPRCILVSSGAQTALAATLSAICKPGDVVAVEPLTYPGFKAVAAQFGVRLVACDVDDQGVTPEGLDRVARSERPVALYLIPAMQNPTASTMGIERRRHIAERAARHKLWVIEDDPYSRLAAAPIPAIATFAADRTIYVSTLSKCLSPGLRMAFVVCPPGALGERIAESLRAIALMPAPLMASVVTSWIRDGVAETLLAGVRREARARRSLAATALPAAVGSPDSLHVWLPLAEDWGPDMLRRAAQDRGLSLVTAEAFAVADGYPNGVRIALGAPLKRAVLAEALNGIAALVSGPPSPPRMVV